MGNSPLLIHHFFFSSSSQTNCVCRLKWRWWEGRLGRAGEREGWRVGKLQSTFQKLLHVHQRHLEHMQLEQLTKFLPRQVVCNFTSFLPLTVRRPRRRGEARKGETFSQSDRRCEATSRVSATSPALRCQAGSRREGRRRRRRREDPSTDAMPGRQPRTRILLPQPGAAAPRPPAEPKRGGSTTRCARAAPGKEHDSGGRAAGGWLDGWRRHGCMDG